jgi:malate dehydrogenase (oxaloacetate-decarboxylating)(NADP+)
MSHLRHIRDIIGAAPGIREFAALSLAITPRGSYFIADTQVQFDPSAEGLVDIAVQAAEHVRRFGLTPRVAFVSHSDFGSYDSESARKMRRAAEMLHAQHPDILSDGEMQADSALSREVRDRVLPHSRLDGDANVLIMPNLDAANIGCQIIKALYDALPVGPILIGPARPAHILTPSVTPRGILNMTAVASVEAQSMTGQSARIA